MYFWEVEVWLFLEHIYFSCFRLISDLHCCDGSLLWGPIMIWISARIKLSIWVAWAFAFLCAQNSRKISLASWKSSKYLGIIAIVWSAWILKWQRSEKSTKLHTHLSALLKSCNWPGPGLFRATARHGSKILRVLRFSNPVYCFTAQTVFSGFLNFGYSVQANHARLNKSDRACFFKSPMIQFIRCLKTPIQVQWSVAGANNSWQFTSCSFQIARGKIFSPVSLVICPMCQSFSPCVNTESRRFLCRIIWRYFEWSRMVYSSSYSSKQSAGT